MISISLLVLDGSVCARCCFCCCCFFFMKNDLFMRPIHSGCAYISIVYVDSLCAHKQYSTSHKSQQSTALKLAVKTEEKSLSKKWQCDKPTVIHIKHVIRMKFAFWVAFVVVVV